MNITILKQFMDLSILEIRLFAYFFFIDYQYVYKKTQNQLI